MCAAASYLLGADSPDVVAGGKAGLCGVIGTALVAVVAVAGGQRHAAQPRRCIGGPTSTTYKHRGKV